MIFQLLLIVICGMICNVYDSDTESITSSQSSKSSRRRSVSRDGRDSSTGSRGSVHDWMVLSEFDDLDDANDFIKTVLTKNATRTSYKKYCEFSDPQETKKHKLNQQIRMCQCTDDCKVQFRFRKCTDCSKAENAQNDCEHTESNLEPERTLRGINKSIIKRY